MIRSKIVKKIEYKTQGVGLTQIPVFDEFVLLSFCPVIRHDVLNGDVGKFV